MTKFKQFYIEYTTEFYQFVCLVLFCTTLILFGILEFKSGVMEAYKANLVMLKGRSDQQIREIAVLEEKYKLQQQEINQLRLRVLTSDNSLRKDIEDLKAKVNPPIKSLKK